MRESIKILSFLGMLFIWNYSNGQNFQDWDMDKDSRISRTEFNDGFENNESSTAQPEVNSEKRVYDVTYSMWDVNNDSRLSADEWSTGAAFNRDYDFEEDFNTYDLDRDNFLSPGEYEDAVSNSNIHESWDSDDDDIVDDVEVADGVFSNWDVNSDSYMDESEFSEFKKYYMSGN